MGGCKDTEDDNETVIQTETTKRVNMAWSFGVLMLLLMALIVFLASYQAHQISTFFASLYGEQPIFLRRRLSAKVDYLTGQSFVTINGVVPQFKCPVGTYRPKGSTKLIMTTGQRVDGCVPCPRGRYGSATGLKASSCSAPCPIGKYGSKVGMTSASDCQLCPPGRYGANTGLTGASCSASTCCTACVAGKYSNAEGASSVVTCLDCLPGFRHSGCIWAVQPRTGQDQDHQEGELRNNKYTVGSNVINGLGLADDPIPIK